MGPAKLWVAVGHQSGGKGVIGDIYATAISYVRKGCDLKKDANPIDIIEVIRSKIGKKAEIIDQLSIICAGEWDKLCLCNFELDAVAGHKLAHGGKPTRSEIGKIDAGGFKQMKAGSRFSCREQSSIRIIVPMES
jgi:hypothetical protein